MKFIFLIFFLFFSVTLFSQKKTYLLLGTYTSGKSTGMYVYDFRSNDGTAKVIDSVKTSNPSYLAVSPDQKFVYAVNEDAEKGIGGKISAYSFNKLNGHLTLLNQQRSMGDNPCYITVDKTGKWVIAGNYSSGTVAVFPINKNGRIDNATTVIQHKGGSINKQRQETPHVHATVLSPDNRYLFVPDLGIDKLMIYFFNSSNGKLLPKDTTLKLTAGSGPRHFVFHPSGKWAYLIQELSGTITAFNYSNGKLKTAQTISCLPADYKGASTSADIHLAPDGKFLYASNRDASNTIAIFKIDQFTGILKLIAHQPTLGKTPRNFNFDPTGNYLLVANQNSDSIVVIKINHETGLLTDTGNHIDVGNPVCIKWIVQ